MGTSMRVAFGMRRWAMAVRASMGLGLRYSAKTQGQGCGQSHRRSPTLKLHGASFLNEKDSSPNGCHGAIMQDKSSLSPLGATPLPNFAKHLVCFAQALQMQKLVHP